VTFHQLGDPRAFIPTFGEDPSAAVATAIEELTAAADENARVRRWKRGLALVALVPPWPARPSLPSRGCMEDDRMRGMSRKSNGGPSEALKRVARQIAEEYDVRTFAPGEPVPPGYFTPNHYTGGSLRRKKGAVPSAVAQSNGRR
jgi:hypothetical protein